MSLTRLKVLYGNVLFSIRFFQDYMVKALILNNEKGVRTRDRPIYPPTDTIGRYLTF